MEASASEPIKVFWQPGCTSCLRTKEFLARQGIEFESINVLDDPQGMAQLRALGARSIPVVSRGDRYTLCQSFDDVIRFLGLETRVTMLPPAELVEKLDAVLAAAARLTRQFSAEQLDVPFRDRDRTPGGTAFHLFRVAEVGLEASQQVELRFEAFDERPPADWGAERIAQWGLDVRTRIRQWWASEPDTTLSYLVPTYYGQRTMHDVLERTTWHAAQHARQLALMVESNGLVPDGPVSAATLAGLPVPEQVWG